MVEEVKEGHWYLPLQVKAEDVYDVAYIAKYEGYEKTDLGKSINDHRLLFVKELSKNVKIVDVGVGSGQFMYSQDCLGYDVNPSMVKRLEAEGRFVNVYSKEEMEDEGINCLTFWDSFEHISDPSMILRNLPPRSIVFMCIPIFRNKCKLEDWVHYREDEHYHYFTNLGLLNYMKDNGFIVTQFSEQETIMGRDDVYTYCFVKED